MAIPKIALFYALYPVADPDAVRLWQRDPCERAFQPVCDRLAAA
jgi:UPF0176 protein